MINLNSNIRPFKIIAFSICILFAHFSFAQKDKVERTWEKQQKSVEYRKERNFKGPKDWSSGYPADLNNEEEEYYIQQNNVPPNSANSPGGNQSYSPQQIEKERKKRYGQSYSGKNNAPPDPELVKPDPIEFPEFDPPTIDGPDIDLPDVDTPDFLTSKGLWNTILFLILFGLVIWLVYLFIKHRQPKDKKIAVQSFDTEWNPETISKTELEVLLESATTSENYRECVRIYFTFILKELSKKGWIKWSKEKTNYHYLLEMQSKKDIFGFQESLRIYEVVWYGDYHISHDTYQQLKPIFVDYYSSLNPTSDD